MNIFTDFTRKYCSEKFEKDLEDTIKFMRKNKVKRLRLDKVEIELE
jgi:hypothetical protein